MDCPICGAEGKVSVEIARKWHFKWKDLQASIDDVEYLYCKVCGETFFNKVQSQEISRKRKALGVAFA